MFARRLLGLSALLLHLALPSAGAAAEKDALAEGREIYNFRCYYCHGYSGNAKTLAATFLTPPPADFTAGDPRRLTPEAIADVLKHGRPGTAMKSFSDVISGLEIAAVAEFVHREFVVAKAVNTRYHTVENGWPDHGRYRLAFPFATGEIPLSRSWESLTPEQARGKRLYLDSCVSCHDRGARDDDDVAWDSRPLSYPRNNFSMSSPPPKVDAMTSASPYAKHDIVPRLARLTAGERRGERIFQGNCAFCHGADGTGKNWIGQFLEPHPRNLQDATFMSGMSRERLRRAISDGLPGTSMPAWKAVLAPGQIRDVIDYVSRAFFPLPPWQPRSGG